MGIEITRQVLDSVSNLFDGENDKNMEIESSFSPEKKINASQFKRCLTYVSSVYSSEIRVEEETLDISTSNIIQNQKRSSDRLSIIGNNAISKYCNTNEIDDIEKSRLVMMNKEQSKKDVVNIDDYYIRFRKSKEKQYSFDQFNSVSENILNSDTKHFRLKKRYSIVLVEQHVRFDFTIVRSYKDIISRGSYDTTYEIELESLKHDKEMGINMLLLMLELLKVIDGSEHLLSRTKQTNLLEEYLELTSQEKEIGKIDKILREPKKYFVGPQPVTLEKKHLNPKIPGSIYDNYTVTVKADGERNIVFVDKQGDVYLINNRLQFRYTGLKSKTPNSLYDSEFVMENNQILLFDSYIVNKEKVFLLPLSNIKEKEKEKEKKDKNPSRDKKERKEKDKEKGRQIDSRLYYMHQFCEEVFEVLKLNMKMNCKAFYIGNDVKDKSNPLFNFTKIIINESSSNTYDYETDGLIFTPALLPVSSSSVDKPVDKLTSGTWLSVFKWKPPNKNSIDFLVKEVPISMSNNTKTFKLFCGKNIFEHDTTYSYLKQYKRKGQNYQSVEFVPPALDGKIHNFLEIELKDNMALFDNNGVFEQLLNDTIVELSFDITERKWYPLRIRQDKTEQYQKSGSISNAANDYKTVMSIWDSITNPITEEMVNGEADIDFGNIEEPYYVRTKDRNSSLTLPMKNFHNEWVKRTSLIAKSATYFKSKFPSISLYDPACGEAGDLQKWVDSNIDVVVGTDVSKHNIYQDSGANDRLSQVRFFQNKRYVFLPIDFSKDLTSSVTNGMKDIDEKDQRLAQIVWGEKGLTSGEDALKTYKDLGKKQFNIISCQFALHYFFESDSTVKNFINNIDKNLKKGGLFIGTVFDGKKVDKLLNDNNGKITQFKVDNGKEVPIWSINKKYTSPFGENSVGQKIGVRVETINDRENDEYLVSLPLLKAKLLERNIRLLNQNELRELNISNSSSMIGFDSLYEQMNTFIRNQNSLGVKIRLDKLKSALDMSEAEKQLSFLYTSFIFIKD